MRKSERKLQLHRETLSSLDSKALANAGGNGPAPASGHCPTDWNFTKPATELEPS